MGQVVQFINDTLRNFTSKMGMSRDKAADSVYSQTYLDDYQIKHAYEGSWLPRKVVDVVAQDSVANWRDWDAKPEQIRLIEAEENRLGVKQKVLEARKQARLWGGAGIIIGDGARDVSTPLNVENVVKGGIKYLAVVNRRLLTVPALEMDPGNPNFGKAVAYQLSSTAQTIVPEIKQPKPSTLANNAQVIIHPSRIAAFYGSPLSDKFEAQSNYGFGWGASVLQAMFDALKNADGAASNIASLLFEAKIDVVKIPNLMGSLADPNYATALTERFTLAMQTKGVNQTLILDSAEEYEQKQVAFANMDKILLSFLQITSGASDIPLTRLLGQSPGGMNSTGEHDMKNYHKNLRSEQELEMKPAMAGLDECIIRSALGSKPKGVSYEWAALSDDDPKTTAEIGQINASSVVAIDSTKLVPRKVLAEVFINQQVEAGVFPGLDTAMEEFIKENPTYYDDLDAADKEMQQANLAATKAKAVVATPARTPNASAGFND